MSYFKGEKEFFPGIGQIQFEGRESKNPLAFHYYDADKVVMGKTLKDHCASLWLIGIPYVLREVISLVVEQNHSLGMTVRTLSPVRSTRWTPLSSL